MSRERALEEALTKIASGSMRICDEQGCTTSRAMQEIARQALAQPATGGDESTEDPAIDVYWQGIQEGYRRGVEDAARVVDACHIERFNGEVIRLDAVVAAIRALSPPPAPPPKEGDKP